MLNTRHDLTLPNPADTIKSRYAVPFHRYLALMLHRSRRNPEARHNPFYAWLHLQMRVGFEVTGANLAWRGLLFSSRDTALA